MQHPDESGQINLILTQSREVAKESQSIFHGFPLRNLCVSDRQLAVEFLLKYLVKITKFLRVIE
jgi:hypothetical protein